MNYEIRKYYGKTDSYSLIENVVLPIDIHLKQNEELDTASFDIVDVNYKRRIPKNTRIEIVETESNTHYQFVVVYDDVELTKQQNGSETILAAQPLYTHHITLVESTSLFEQIQLPNIISSKQYSKLTNTISNADEFISILNEPNSNQEYYLKSDINIDVLNVSMDAFDGKLYGDGHTITINNFEILYSEKDYCGLFGVLTNTARIENVNFVIRNVNLNITNPMTTKQKGAGVLVGINNGVIAKTNVDIDSARIYVEDFAQNTTVPIGIIGRNNSTITDCQFNCNTFTADCEDKHSATLSIGGFVGTNYGFIFNCSYVGDKVVRSNRGFSTYQDYVCGFCGQNFDTLKNIYLVLQTGLYTNGNIVEIAYLSTSKNRYKKYKNAINSYYYAPYSQYSVEYSSGTYVADFESMKNQNTYTNWDFATYWSTNNNTTLPQNIAFYNNKNFSASVYLIDIFDRLVNLIDKKYEVSEELKSKISNSNYGDVTEFFFNELNFLEILREIGTKINGIPKLVDYKYIDYYFLNQNEKEWNDELYNYSNEENLQNPDEYCTNLVSFGKNIVSSEATAEGNIVYPYDGGFVSSKCAFNQTTRISNDTAIFYLGGNKIYDIQSFKITNFDNNNPSRIIELKSYLYEKTQYDTLPDTDDGKGRALIYDQYGTYIYGLSNQPIAGFTPPYTALANILRTDFGVDSVKSFQDIKYNCTFRTSYNNVERTEKLNNSDFPFDADLVLNQTTNQLSSQNFSSYKSAKMNKLGNIEKSRFYIFDDILEMPQIGEVVSSTKYYVNEIKMQLFQNCVIAQIITTKDFNKISEFISINSRKRPFELPIDNFVSERHDNVCEYIRLSTSNNKLISYGNTTENSGISKNFLNTIFSAFSNEENNSFKECNLARIKTYDSQNNEIANILVSCNSYVGANNSLCYSFGMLDNISAGYKSSNYNSINRSLTNVLYAKDGIVDHLDYELFTDFSTAQDISYDLPQLTTSNYDATSIFSKSNKLILKDAREIENITTQITFVTDESDVFIRKALLTRNPTINSVYGYVTPKLYCLTNRVLGEYEINVPSDAVEISFDSIPETTVYDEYAVIGFKCQPVNCKSWFLAYSDNSIILGANKNLEEYNYIYAKPSIDRLSSINPYLIIEMEVNTNNELPFNILRNSITYESHDDDRYNLVDFGDGNIVIGDIVGANHEYIPSNEPYKYSLYSNNVKTFIADTTTSQDGVKISSINIFYDGIRSLILSNNDRRVQNVQIPILDITNKPSMIFLDVSNVETLQNILIDKNNGLKNIDVSNTGFINNQDILLNIIDNLQYNESEEIYTFYAGGITDTTIRQNVRTALALKNWEYE